MSPRKPVPTLFILTISTVCNDVLAFVKCHKCPVNTSKIVKKEPTTLIGKIRALIMEICNNYFPWSTIQDGDCTTGVTCSVLANGREELSVLPSTVAQSVLEKLLSDPELLYPSEHFTRRLLYLLLMRTDFKQIQFFGKREMTVLASKNKHLLKNIEALCVSSLGESKITNICVRHVLSGIPSLFPKLKSLEITGVYDINAILPPIGRCPNIRYLKVLGYHVITDVGIQSLCYSDYPKNKKGNPICKVIEHVDLGIYRGLTLSVVSDFISNSPKLRNFDWYNQTGQALVNLIHRGQRYPANMETIWDEYTNQNTIEILSKFGFDRLRKISLFKPKDEAVTKLRNFTSLTKIELFNVHANPVTNMMHECQSKLTELILYIDSGTFNLSTIASQCENLERFRFKSKYDFSFHPVIPFQKLQTFYLDNTYSDADLILNIMESLPKIKFLKICQSESLTDDDIINLVTGGTTIFADLQQLCLLHCSNLTSTSFLTLILNCSNLKVLGSIGEFEMFDNVLMDMLEYYTKTENMDIKFVTDI